MLWDESNMLKAIRIADQSLQHYIYDAHGERTLKGKGNVTVVSVNGVPQSTTATIGNYTIYESGYIVVGPNGYVTKHYYNGSERVSSRLGGSVSGYLSGAAVGGAETATLPSRQQVDLTYVFGQFGLGTVTVTNQPPAPGDCEVAGNCASNLYYFHPDHVGSSTFLSDQNGQPYQFLLYLPFGESMASQKAGGWATPYKFNGKELDDETGMYYYGARYYDPRISLWHGVDKMASDYPTFSPYVYTANNPLRYIDPDDNFLLDVHQRITVNASKGFEINFGRKNRANNKEFMYGLMGTGTILSGGVTYPDLRETNNKSSHFDGMNYSQIKNNFRSIFSSTIEIIEGYKNGKMTEFGFGHLVGRNLHTIQDFYSHSNYIELYIQQYGETSLDLIPTFQDVLSDPQYSDFSQLLESNLKTGEYPGTGSGSHREMNHDVGAGSNYTNVVPETKGKNITYNTRAAEAVATKATKQYLNTIKNGVEQN